MGLFSSIRKSSKKKKSKKDARPQPESPPDVSVDTDMSQMGISEVAEDDSTEVHTPAVEEEQSNEVSKEQNTKARSETPLSVLIDDLATSQNPSGEKAARALRTLFTRSEHSERLAADGQLVPVLLEFLRRCHKNSSEQYLALLVLNNISIPASNKKQIALDCGGAHILSRLLCEDPSCHLLAIILVNLTFADAELRRLLVRSSSIQLLDGLAYAIWVACATPEEQHSRGVIQMEGEVSPRGLLEEAMGMEERLRKGSSLDSVLDGRLFDPSRQLYPETARWCLCALKNLTRPTKDASAAQSVLNTGIVPLILRIITIAKIEAGASDAWSNTEENNAPSTWESNSIQDAALFTILNLSSFQAVRSALIEENAGPILFLIADCPQGKEEPTSKSLAQFQRLKARMALAYLYGSSGHYGQTPPHTPTPAPYLHITPLEVEHLLELLANTLHQRPKPGVGGYSAATFTPKFVLGAIRNLLTDGNNGVLTAMIADTRLNLLLVKALSMYVLRMGGVDGEGVEYAVFSLYLQSDYGFHGHFLPSSIGECNARLLVEKVVSAYIKLDNVTPAGVHAGRQILLRLEYLNFYGSTADLEPLGDTLIKTSDYEFEDEFSDLIDGIVLDTPLTGTKPLGIIFERPILRSRSQKNNTTGTPPPWHDHDYFTEFPSALAAVKELSYGSSEVRHMDPIDDITIANDIANCANGNKTEDYNYWWMWKDVAPEMQRNLSHRKQSGFENFMKGSTMSAEDDFEPVGIFGFKCAAPAFCQQPCQQPR